MDSLNSGVLMIEKVAELLKIPRSSVYELVQERKPPALKGGWHWQFYCHALPRWISDQISLESWQYTPKKMDFS